MPFQIVQSWGTASNRNRISFVADLPSLGYRTYRMVTRTISPEPSLRLSRGVRCRAGERPLAGWRSIRRPAVSAACTISAAETRFLWARQASRSSSRTRTDTWGHNQFKFDKVIGRFEPVSVRLVENGPVKAVIRVTSSYGASQLIQDFTMYRELEQIEVRATVDWHEQHKMLKLRFPGNLTFMRATYEIPYGHIQRFANGEEEPGQSWLDLSGITRDTGEMYGYSILNDGKYSFDVNVRDVGLTVLRSPVYANHMPVVPAPDGHYSFVDQGIQHFTYSILPHAGSWETAGTVQRAAELNQRPIALISTYHPNGSLPPSDSYPERGCRERGGHRAQTGRG